MARPDFPRRLNLYSPATDTTHDLFGLLEPNLYGTKLRDDLKVEPCGFDFHGSYDETLFRGYIDPSRPGGDAYLKARRVKPSGTLAKPQNLGGGRDNNWRCDFME